MKDILDALVKIQGVDSEVHRYEVQRDELKAKLEQLQELVRRMQKNIDDKKEKLQEVENWYSSQQKAIAEDDARIHTLKISLNSVSKNKEYLLRQREMESLKKAKGQKEEELKKAEEALLEFRLTIEEDQQRLDNLKSETVTDGGSGWKQVEACDEKIQQIATKKQDLLPLLPSNILRKYEQIRKNRDGLAVVPVLDGCCTGCHVQVRPQLCNNLLLYTSIENCPVCSRFIYIPQEEYQRIMAQSAAEQESQDS